MHDVQEQITANKRTTFLIVALFFLTWFVIFAAIGVVLAGIVVGLLIGLVVAGGLTALAYFSSESVVLRAAHAHPADEVAQARYYNLVEGLCIGSGLPRPRLYVVDDPAPNAFAAGRTPKRAALVLTTGMLEQMNRVELEGVIAHELSHIRNLDVLPMTVVVTMVPIPALRDRLVGPLEYQADASGVQMTRYPPGLISALKKLEDDDTTMHAPSKATAHLWIEDPRAAPSNGPAHPPLADRIRALEGL